MNIKQAIVSFKRYSQLKRKLLFLFCILLAGALYSFVTKDTVSTRFSSPKGFSRENGVKGSFADFLQSLPLKPQGSRVLYYDGRVKSANVYDAVINYPIGKKDLHQCADAVIRLRAEWLYRERRFDDITFNFTNGFKADYSKWRQGYRITVKGNTCTWVKSAVASDTYESFWKYLETVFTYAGTISLSKALTPKSIEKIEAGDVFIQGGSPGHAVIVVDMVKNTKGERKFLLAQSYMPAQEIQILKNPGSSELWYSNRSGGRIVTPEWIFNERDLKAF